MVASKPPEPRLTAFQSFQKRATEAARILAEKASDAGDALASGLGKVDERFELTAKAKQVGEAVAEKYQEVDERLQLATRAKSVAERGTQAARAASEMASEKAREHGVNGAMDGLSERLASTKRAIQESQSYQAALAVAEKSYGGVRQGVKGLMAPALPTFEQDELLLATEEELAYISACIMQISVADSRNLGPRFGRALIMKTSGAAAVGGVLSLVATFGTAGTGTAIAALHGAAATSASLAWVGGLVGGGMAAGTVLTGGIALIAAMGAYKALSSERRAVESLNETELWVVQCCWTLQALCADYRRQPFAFDLAATEQLVDGALKPLQAKLAQQLDKLCAPLDSKNALALRQHALPDLQSRVLDRFTPYIEWLKTKEGRSWLRRRSRLARKVRLKAASPVVEVRVDDRHAMYAIGGVFGALLTREPLDDSLESRLVVSALRRSAKELESASTEVLCDYLRSKTDEQRQGIAVNVKGIYHEEVYVHKHNLSDQETEARLFPDTNHPGADVQFFDRETGEVIGTIQLKAVVSVGAVHAHLSCYPDVDVAATSEVAGQFDDERVVNSGFENASLTADVDNVTQRLHDHTVLNRVEQSAAIALGAASLDEVLQMMQGQKEFPRAVVDAAGKVGTTAAATAMVAVLFG